jgi:hypothetical protein
MFFICAGMRCWVMRTRGGSFPPFPTLTFLSSAVANEWSTSPFSSRQACAILREERPRFRCGEWLMCGDNAVAFFILLEDSIMGAHVRMGLGEVGTWLGWVPLMSAGLGQGSPQLRDVSRNMHVVPACVCQDIAVQITCFHATHHHCLIRCRAPEFSSLDQICICFGRRGCTVCICAPQSRSISFTAMQWFV